MREMKRGELHGTNVLSLAVSHFQLTDTVHGRNADAPPHYHELPLICLVLQGVVRRADRRPPP
ncbi:MAG TPA: hypothetical protein VEK57_16765 [Thermoanaerobaculia bacterium]|nr:hypothetical protein [Thermoanaerobaculia bacterium]